MYVGYLIGMLNPENAKLAVQIQACETLAYIFKDSGCIDRMSGEFNMILRSLIGVFPYQRQNQFFDIFHDVILNYCE
jgi:hypothetical protein